MATYVSPGGAALVKDRPHEARKHEAQDVQREFSVEKNSFVVAPILHPFLFFVLFFKWFYRGSVRRTPIGPRPDDGSFRRLMMKGPWICN